MLATEPTGSGPLHAPLLVSLQFASVVHACGVAPEQKPVQPEVCWMPPALVQNVSQAVTQAALPSQAPMLPSERRSMPSFAPPVQAMVPGGVQGEVAGVMQTKPIEGMLIGSMWRMMQAMSAWSLVIAPRSSLIWPRIGNSAAPAAPRRSARSC